MVKHLALCFPVRIDLVCKGVLPAHEGFQGGDMLNLIQMGLFSWVEETHVSLERNPSKLQAGVSSTFFACENWVSFWKRILPSF
jgi:hypothetical protein